MISKIFAIDPAFPYIRVARPNWAVSKAKASDPDQLRVLDPTVE